MPRQKQGAGRHDIPERDGVIYASRVSVSAVAEALKSFRGQTVPGSLFERTDGNNIALATLTLDDGTTLVDLDDATELAHRRITPSHVASIDRPTTQAIARRIFDEGAAGIAWWSALKSSWKNATLFETRVKGRLLAVDIEILRPGLELVARAAAEVFVRFK